MARVHFCVTALAWALTALLVIALVGAVQAHAKSTRNGISSHVKGDAIEVEGRLHGPERANQAGTPFSRVGGHVATYSFTTVPACTGNDPNAENGDAFCAEADALCPPGQTMYWLFRALSSAGPGEGWNRVGQRCQGSRDPGTPRPIFPGFTQTDFQRLPLPAAKASVEPSNGYTLVHVPTNVYAEADPVTLDTELLGFPVRVRATPSQYSWDFGDGSTVGPTTDPGAPYPDLSITHEYAEAGTFTVTLTTYYTGEYSVAGGPWLPIDGEAEVASPSIGVEALAGRSELVADSTTG